METVRRRARSRRVEFESLKISLWYGGVAALYIVVSDRLLFYWVKDPDRMSWIAAGKGVVFVIVTSVILYFMVRHFMDDLLRVREQAWAAQKNDALGRMAAGVAHDFNNILQVVTSSSQVGVDLAKAERPDLAELFAQSQGAATRGRDLVRHLMAFARQQPSQTQVIPVLDLLRMVQSLLKGIVRPPFMLIMEVSADAGSIEVDPVNLEQVIMNLVVNALDSMGREGGGAVSVRAQGRGSWVELVVEDTGSGIAPDVLPHIFEPFYSTKGGHGTGLGLATVHSIVRNWGGTIEVRSRSQEGSSFHILVPAAAPLP
jgi:signal transduction histidine kinase